MLDLIESNPEILGRNPVIKETRILAALIYELVGLGYSIEEIKKEYPYLERKDIVKVIELGNKGF